MPLYNANLKNPLGLDTGSHRVLRGGSWKSNETNDLRVAFHYNNAPAHRCRHLGFRYVSGSKFTPTVPGEVSKPASKLTGDVNGDGTVNIFDLVIVAGNFGQFLLAAPATRLRWSSAQIRSIIPLISANCWCFSLTTAFR